MPPDLLVAASSLVFLAAGVALGLAWRRGAAAAATSAATALREALLPRLDALDRALERLDRGQREELAAARGEASRAALEQREELRRVLRDGAEATRASLAEVAKVQKEELAAFGGQILRLTEASERRLEAVRATVEERLALLQKDNGERLDRMRATVDEKLQGTLEKRLGDSFRLVSERLEAVQRGLGEMQTLATGVGDLKKVLSNVKVRGTWGEVQLGSLLEQVLAPGQYATNVATRRDGRERVEFAVRLPGRADGDAEVLLPIDAKFPVEDYQRLVEASERGDAKAVEASAAALAERIWACAKDIHDKYLEPPRTTDFGILFLPTEGLYAEVIRRPGLVEELQRELKVTVAGPTTLTATLNALQMGFRTLAIQRRSSEVWEVLGAIKTEWGKFGGVLQKVEKKLVEASRTLHEVGTRQRAIDRKLRDVQELPAGEARRLLPELAVLALEPGEEEFEADQA
jgi:DNA recombination protein RmuC